MNSTFEPVESARSFEAESKTEPRLSPEELKVMTWNVKFGGGRIDFFFDCHGDRVIMEKSEVLANLEGLARKINRVDPDILFLQEVDIESKRVAYIDQLQWLLNHTSLNYAEYASHWRSRYIPKYWLGRMNSGNAILSKWPLENGKRYALPLIEEQDFITQYFYLKRNILSAEISLPHTSDTPLLLNTHLSAFSDDGTKKKQLKVLEKHLDGIASADRDFLVGADLNTLPPGTDKRKDFPDDVCQGEFNASDYTGEKNWLRPLYEDYQFAIPLSDYSSDNRSYFTHTTDKDGFWNRKLDYLLGTKPLKRGDVLQGGSSDKIDTMPLSDHAPVTARWDL